MEKVNIVGGSSTSGRVSILSDEFVATAHFETGGQITCKVTRHSPLSRFLNKHKRLPIPRVVRMALLFASSMTGKGWLLLGLYTVGLFALKKIDVVFSSPSATFLNQHPWILYAALLGWTLRYIHRYIAPWHGAEHMAIAAYDRTGAADMAAITHECPIHDLCGGRLFFPIVAGTALTNFIAKTVGVNTVMSLLIMLECILWIDVLRGWNEIPGASHASRLLQRWVTTRHPGENELRTAQRALQELIAAHRRVA